MNTFLLMARMVDRKLGERLVSRRKGKRGKRLDEYMKRRRSKSNGSSGDRSRMMACVRGRKPGQ